MKEKWKHGASSALVEVSEMQMATALAVDVTVMVEVFAAVALVMDY